MRIWGINRIKLEFKEELRLGTFLLLCVLIESDWNLKYKDTASAFPTGKSINRIRLEFKGVQKSMKTRQVEVLIESDWNLKKCLARAKRVKK